MTITKSISNSENYHTHDQCQFESQFTTDSIKTSAKIKDTKKLRENINTPYSFIIK